MDKKYISKFINLEFFEYPAGKIASNYNAFKYGVVGNIIELINPYLIICNKGSRFDKVFVSKMITSDFVFLKDEVIQNLYNGTLTDSEKKRLNQSFHTLKDAFISVVIFPEKTYSIFGGCSPLPQAVTEFIFETKFDIKYLNIIGSYYTYPVWSKEPRRYEIKFTQQFSVDSRRLKQLSADERNILINHYMPSSATTYAMKYPAIIRSKNRAENFETIMYLCPNCGHLFSMYSEFNCLKCRECGTALEFSPDGAIVLSNKINTFDEIETFMFEKLRKRSFSTKELISYPNVDIVLSNYKGKINSVSDYKLTVFADRIELLNGKNKKVINFSDISDITLDYNNIVAIAYDDKKIVLRGNHKENFYIMIDLNKINKS